MSPPKELSLEEQAITQTTPDTTKKEVLAAKRCALKMANNGLKQEKARSLL